MSRLCPVCNKPLPENATGRQKYCSPKCRLSTYRKNPEAVREPYRRKIKTFTCIICGKEFSSDHSFAFYCSDDCRKAAARNSAKRFRDKHARPYHKCHADGCEIMTHGYFCHVHRRKFKTCSFMPELAGI